MRCGDYCLNINNESFPSQYLDIHGGSKLQNMSKLQNILFFLLLSSNNSITLFSMCTAKCINIIFYIFNNIRINLKLIKK